MAVVNFPLSISLTSPGFEREVLKAIADKFNSAMRAGYEAAVKLRVGQELETKIRLTPQYAAMVGGGREWGEMGVLHPVTAINGIVSGLKASMDMAISLATVSGTTLRGGCSLYVSRSDFEDVLSAPFSSFPSNDHVVDWLEYMLMPGAGVAIAGWSFDPGNSVASRTRQGVMIKTGKDWHVPPVFQGTFGNNWITLLLSMIQPIVEQILIEELERRL